MFIRGNNGKGKNYYFQLKDPISGTYTSARSTRTSSHAEAIKIAKEAARFRSLDTTSSSSIGPRTKVNDYISLFWDENKSPEIILKRDHNPNAMQSNHANAMGSYYRRYVQPLVSHLRLIDLNPAVLETIQRALKKKYSHLKPQTINSVFRSLTQPLRVAAKKWIIPKDPTEGVITYASERRVTGVFSQPEIQALTDLEWPDQDGKLAFLTALNTGLRNGEIRGLRIQDFEVLGTEGNHLPIIHLKHSWSKTHGLKCPKNGKSRPAPIPQHLYQQLVEKASENPHSDGFIFWSDKPGKPFSDKLMTESLKYALQKIGINTLEQEKRNLRFHSTRHSFNSIMASKVDNDSLRTVLGHGSPQMTAHYFHASIEELRLVQKVQLDYFPSKSIASQEVSS